MSLLDVILDPTEVSEYEKGIRKLICNTCERKSKINICKECKCIIDLKVLFEVESCPLNKW